MSDHEQKPTGLKLRYFLGLFFTFGLFASADAIHNHLFSPARRSSAEALDPNSQAMEANAPNLPTRNPASARPTVPASRPHYPEQPYVPPMRPAESDAFEPVVSEPTATPEPGFIAGVGGALARALGLSDAPPAPPPAPAAPPAAIAAGGGIGGAASSTSTNTNTSTSSATSTSDTGTLVWGQSNWGAATWAQ